MRVAWWIWCDDSVKGTSAGIGSARNPPVYVKSGDRIECAVEGIGSQNNPVVKEVYQEDGVNGRE